jgi:hypothetical protein
MGVGFLAFPQGPAARAPARCCRRGRAGRPPGSPRRTRAAARAPRPPGWPAAPRPPRPPLKRWTAPRPQTTRPRPLAGRQMPLPRARGGGARARAAGRPGLLCGGGQELASWRSAAGPRAVCPGRLQAAPAHLQPGCPLPLLPSMHRSISPKHPRTRSLTSHHSQKVVKLRLVKRQQALRSPHITTEKEASRGGTPRHLLAHPLT